MWLHLILMYYASIYFEGTEKNHETTATIVAKPMALSACDYDDGH
jgi:hypothetical protein